jgi:hypothetical protein
MSIAKTCPDPFLMRWFGNSKVTGEFGHPLVVYRGEHGSLNVATDGNRIQDRFGSFQTRLAALSFGTVSAAKLYALKPNNRDDFPVAPRLYSAYLSIQNPIMNRPDDPFVELDDIAKAVGKSVARDVAIHFGDHITNTCNWLDDIGMKFETFENYLNSSSFNLSDIYFDAYALFDDGQYAPIFRNAGFDGVIHGGCGETFGEAEYKVFSAKQVWLLPSKDGVYEKLAR